MSYFDIFNGDADGICALVQLRNAEPRESRLVTGVKRDIQLVRQVEAAEGDELTVLDVSFDKNREGVLSALSAGASIFYVDHHFAGDMPSHPRLETLIDVQPDTCTSLLVNQHLSGRYAGWAVVGAFGDNLDGAARRLAQSERFEADVVDRLRRLGTYLNYNGYGASLEDLHFTPDALLTLALRHPTPTKFIEAEATTFAELESGYEQDMAAVASRVPVREAAHGAVIMLPDAAWARRVSGVYGNSLVERYPERAHAVITERSDGTYLVSLRAPLSNKTGADELARQFPTGGGRAAAAGINELPTDQLEPFMEAFMTFFAER